MQNLAIAYIALWAISPPLFSSDTGRVFVLIATAAWFFLEFLRRDSILLRPTLPVLLALFFMAYTGFFEVLVSGPGGLLSQIQIWIMLFFLVIFQSRRNDLQSLTPIFWFVLAVLPVWLIITIKTVLYDDAHAARVIVRSSSSAEALVEQGVGGYGLVYGAMLLLPSLLILLVNGLKTKSVVLPKPLHVMPRVAQGLLVLNLGLCVFLILTAGYAIAAITLVVVVTLTVFLKSYSAMRFTTTVLALLLFLLFVVPILEWALTAILPFAKGTNFAFKIDDILQSLQIGEAVGAAEGRVERYVRSIQLFIDNPIIGTLVVDHVGKHSEILDTLAQWGVIVGGVFVYLVTFLPLRVLRADRTSFGAGLAMLTAVLMTFGLNNGFAGAGLMLYIMFPVGSHMLKGSSRQSKSVVWGSLRA